MITSAPAASARLKRRSDTTDGPPVRARTAT
jgi:hypothetical protein